MRRQLTAAIFLMGAPLVVLPAATIAQAPPPLPTSSAKLVTPLPTSCVSAPFGSPRPDRPTIPNFRITQGTPGRRFTIIPTADVGPNYTFTKGTFDADGNATVPLFVLGSFLPVGPGRTYRIELDTNGPDSPTPENNTPTRDELGTVTAAALGAQLTHLDGKPNGSYAPGQKNRVVVSGAPFAHKTLYGFIVKGGKKVVGSFKFGTADACGYAEKTNLITHPKSYKSVPSLKVYVNVGPKFDKAHAVRTVSA